jgi:hypothetical protein
VQHFRLRKEKDPAHYSSLSLNDRRLTTSNPNASAVM